MFNPDEARTIYALGNVGLILVNRASRKIIISNDEATDYDWNYGKGSKQNLLIKLERFRCGLDDSHGFKTYYYGFGKLKK